MIEELEGRDISCEISREYDFGGRVYKIDNPRLLYFRAGGSTHRVVDSNDIVHCVPAPGFNGCVLRWTPRNNSHPVSF